MFILRKIKKILVAFSCLVFLFTGCEKKSEQPKPKVQMIKKDIPAQTKVDTKAATLKTENTESVAIDEELAIAELATPVAMVQLYNPKGKIDPFVPLLKNEADKKVTPVVKPEKKKIVRRLTPLEKMDLSQLKLVGIIRSQKGNKALVEESMGKGYVIKKGTYIGLNSGRVTKILKEKIIIEEEEQDVYGRTAIVEKELKLLKPLGE